MLKKLGWWEFSVLKKASLVGIFCLKKTGQVDTSGSESKNNKFEEDSIFIVTRRIRNAIW